MDAFDFLGEQVVTTPAGRVAVSLAGHEDGAVSVVAWLTATGRRVGYIYSRPRQRQPQEAMIDAVLEGTVVRPLMETLLASAHGQRPLTAAVGKRLVESGLMTEEQLADLLGWQWLLAEVGQPRRIGELAVSAGLVDRDAVEVRDDVVERRAPAHHTGSVLTPPVVSDLVGAGV
jgi:hypothetical protein